MDAPSLSFENADLNDSRAMLTMAVMGGSQITLKKESVGWKPTKISEIDPLQGPKLFLDLLLNKVPGDVDNDGRVKLDLSESDNFRLTFGETPHAQRMGGDFFKDLFKQLSDDERIYPLGTIQPGTHDLLRPQSFELRTQARKAFANDEEGAILALIRTMSRNGGNFPGSNYKYLIPDDAGKDYSATVLFDRRRTAGAALLSEMMSLLGHNDFSYEFDDAGEIVKATAASGQFVVPKHEFTLEEKIVVDGKEFGPYTFGVRVPEFTISVAQPNSLVIDFTGKTVSLRLHSKQKVDTWINFSVLWSPHTVEFEVDILVEYEVVEDAAGVWLKQTKFEASSSPATVSAGQEAQFPQTPEQREEFLESRQGVSAEPAQWPETPEEWATFIALALIAIGYVIGAAVANKGVAPKLKETFKPIIGTDVFINDLIHETIKLNFGQAIQGNEVYAPGDIGLFGRINPAPTTFAITQMQPVLLHSAAFQFTTEPAVSNLQWQVDNLVANTGSPGTINKDTGHYVAPAAASIDGRFNRVRVTATAPSGYYSSALVTVVVNALTVDPLIQVCDLNTTVELRAGHLGEGAVSWKIKNPVPGESGTVRPSDKPDGDHTYHHGGPVEEKTYLLDEIEVSTPTGDKRSVHVLALMQAPGLTVNIVNMDIAKGEVQLEAIINKKVWAADWSLPLNGPGSIDENGLYRMDPTSTERFVLIFGVLNHEDFGKFEGYLILPLPLVDFSDLFEVMKQ